MSNQTVFHLGLTRDQLENIDLVLLPGDPQRVPKIAMHLENTKTLAHLREFHSIVGERDGRRILITSTGIGGPSAAIAVEELAMLGLKNFLRIGTTGAIQEGIKAGDLIISTGAVRLDGASRHIAPIEYPAIANFEMIAALNQAAKKSGATFHCGITASSDTFYQGQNRLDSFRNGFLIRAMRDQLTELKGLNVLSYEMEAATIFTQAACYGLRAACILGVLVNRNHDEFPSDETLKKTENTVIEVAIQSLDYL